MDSAESFHWAELPVRRSLPLLENLMKSDLTGKNVRQAD